MDFSNLIGLTLSVFAILIGIYKMNQDLKKDLKDDIKSSRIEVKKEINDLRTELKTEFKNDIGSLELKTDYLQKEMKAGFDSAETKTDSFRREWKEDLSLVRSDVIYIRERIDKLVDSFAISEINRIKKKRSGSKKVA